MPSPKTSSAKSRPSGCAVADLGDDDETPTNPQRPMALPKPVTSVVLQNPLVPPPAASPTPQDHGVPAPLAKESDSVSEDPLGVVRKLNENDKQRETKEKKRAARAPWYAGILTSLVGVGGGLITHHLGSTRDRAEIAVASTARTEARLDQLEHDRSEDRAQALQVAKDVAATNANLKLVLERMKVSRSLWDDGR